MANETAGKRIADMTGPELRRVVVSGVASGVLLAGLVLLLLNVAIGVVAGSVMSALR